MNCAECGCPTDRRIYINGLDGNRRGPLCNACTEMWLAAASSQYMQQIQREYLERTQNLKRLRSGADYFG